LSKATYEQVKSVSQLVLRYLDPLHMSSYALACGLHSAKSLVWCVDYSWSCKNPVSFF